MARPYNRKRSTQSSAVVSLRNALGLTQQDFAYQLGCAVTTVARWETSHPPHGLTAVKLATYASDCGFPEIAKRFLVTEIKVLLDRYSAAVGRTA